MKYMQILLVVIVFSILSFSTTVFAGLSDYFVETDWLENNRGNVVIVDVRNPALYLLGHINGAVNISKNEFLSTRNGVKSLVPEVGEFERLMDRYGIKPDTVVVAYSQDDNPYMARFVWNLRLYGHDKSYVLNGGYDKWVAEGGATSLLPAMAEAASGYRVSGSADIRADADYVMSRMNKPSALIWDTRRKSEFVGTEIRADRGGHIPGAVHLEWLSLLKEQNGVKVLREEKEIQQLLETAGITRDLEIVAHCQTGIRSSYATLVLVSMGYRVKNYDGSWIEWANNDTYPVDGRHEETSRVSTSLDQ
jgi:thiosulfate/3-mercaptopyruvate sulfurtransferase